MFLHRERPMIFWAFRPIVVFLLPMTASGKSPGGRASWLVFIGAEISFHSRVHSTVPPSASITLNDVISCDPSSRVHPITPDLNEWLASLGGYFLSTQSGQADPAMGRGPQGFSYLFGLLTFEVQSNKPLVEPLAITLCWSHWVISTSSWKIGHKRPKSDWRVSTYPMKILLTRTLRSSHVITSEENERLNIYSKHIFKSISLSLRLMMLLL